jgi:hypothetical protein
VIQTAGDFASSNTFDSRDVIETIESLESTVTTFDESIETGICLNCDDAEVAHIPDEDDPTILWCGGNDEDDRTDLKTLRAFAKDCEGYISDWKWGETFIADTYFEAWAEQYASDVTDYNANESSWPYTHIDWEAAADDLKQDYTEFELLGNTFWAR